MVRFAIFGSLKVWSNTPIAAEMPRAWSLVGKIVRGLRLSVHHLGCGLPFCQGSMGSNTKRPMAFKLGMTE
jgi:hypothetical protein